MGDVKVQSTNQLKLQNITYELPQNKHTTAWDQKNPTSDQQTKVKKKKKNMKSNKKIYGSYIIT